MASKPLPTPTAVSRPYWEAASEGRLAIPRCGACGRRFFYPRSHCPACLSDAIEWEQASGRGRVHSFTVIRQATTPGFEADVPYVYAIIELAEGVRLPSNVVECDPGRVTVDMEVEVIFHDAGDGVTLPKFRPLATVG